MAIYLASDTPSAKVEGDQIAVEIPSGDSTVTIALDLHQALFLKRHLFVALDELQASVRERPTGKVIAFPTKRVLSLAKRERELNAVIRDFPDAFTAKR